VVEHLVGEAGIRQIFDIGAGLPTSPKVHEVAHAIAPDTRVIYVDNDPIVMAHARALMPSIEAATVGFVQGDLRCPTTIVDNPRMRDMLDPGAPTAVLLLAMLMFLTDAEDPGRVVDQLMGALPSGSYLAATHTTADFNPPAMADHAAAAAEAGMRFVPRSRPEFERFFHGLDLVDLGVVPVLGWRPRGVEVPNPHSVYIYAGLGRKR
jgi:O-methyltransferase involved in polyketide biosynthesis